MNRAQAPVNPAEVIAEALAKHDGHGDDAFDDFYACSCGEWDTDTVVYDERKTAHVAHQASVIAALPDIAIVDRTRAWYVMRDGRFSAGGQPIAGPFNTQADASAARRALEHSESHGDYWLDSKATLAAARGES